MNQLTEMQKAYIAGFIDGEGCIRVRRMRSRGKVCEFNFEAQVIVTNTNLDILEKLKNITGIGTLYVYKKFPKEGEGKWKPCHRWQVVSSQAEDLLNAIYPYLEIKRKQTEAVLNFPYVGKGHRRTQEEYDNQMQHFSQIKEMNKRGVLALEGD